MEESISTSLLRMAGRAVAVLALVALGIQGVQNGSRNGMPEDARGPDSVSFPKHGTTSDLDEILNRYPDYLRFVLTVGRDVDRPTAQRLEKTYDALRKQDQVGAARFLRGLRFEMVQKLELLGLSESSVSTSSPVIRRWVAKYLPAWLREADEYLFRARTAAIARK